MGCEPYWNQLKEVRKAMTTMRRAGIQIENPAYKQLERARAAIINATGFKVPRTVTALLKLIGASPGELTLWHDAEAGWMLEVRETPGAPPVYNSVPDEVAMDILQGRRIHEHHESYSRAPVDIDN